MLNSFLIVEKQVIMSVVFFTLKSKFIWLNELQFLNSHIWNFQKSIFRKNILSPNSYLSRKLTVKYIFFSKLIKKNYNLHIYKLKSNSRSFKCANKKQHIPPGYFCPVLKISSRISDIFQPITNKFNVRRFKILFLNCTLWFINK